MSRFTIDNRNFRLDGKPFQIRSGALHYFRILPGQWEDRLRRLRAMGLNTVETYVPWNLHEPSPGRYDFSGMLDVARFLKTAQSLGLYAIVRPSPYICAEWEFGGQPGWLLQGDEPIPVRTRQGPFLSLMDRFYGELMPRLAPLQIDQGGPILLMQVENEYGVYGEDKAYLQEMADILRRHGATVPFFTSDNFENDISRGTFPGALPAANFGSGAKEKFRKLAEINGGGPLMCAEFWDGWFDAWGDKHHHTTDAETAAHELDEVLKRGSVNIYMVCGGTNFGFMNGANYYGFLTPDVTSYDYDAPLGEDGSVREKYLAFREVLAKYDPNIPPVPADPRRASYGTVPRDGCAPLFDGLNALSQAKRIRTPCWMEKLGQNYGYILYRHRLTDAVHSLTLPARDRVQVFVDGEPRLTLLDLEIPGAHPIEAPAGATLDILVENLGRVNYGPHLKDQRKGLVGAVLADGKTLTGWEAWSLPLTDLSGLTFSAEAPGRGPCFHRFSFRLEGEPADTWLDFTGWGKGCAFLNGFHLGRYWDIGPQRRLYIPAPLLHAGENTLILFETEGRDPGRVTLAGEPKLG